MRGLRIYEAVYEADAPAYQGSTFAYFFSPILPRLELVHWLYQSFPFSFPREWEDTDYCSAGITRMPDNNGYIAPNVLLPRFAQYVCDDWSSIFGFNAFPDAPRVFAHLEPRDYGFMGRDIDLSFFSIDGAYWDFYTHDESLLDAVHAHASALPHVKVELVDFSKFDV